MGQFDLKGKTAIVTGGNGGIGRGLALALAAAGANVCIAARNADKMANTQAELEALGAQAMSITCDVTDLEQIQRTIEETTERFGGCDILINNAGIGQGSPPEDLADEDWDRTIATNLSSVFRFCRAVYPVFKARGGGKIINIGSEYSLFGSPMVADYSASKGGVIQLTKSLAVAWAHANIQVNAIIPGWITSDMTEPVKADTEFFEAIVQRTPAHRFGEPEELGGASVLLASAASDFITGQSIVVDGGYSIS
ncbi:MAG: glucose 1-dehydrogenase [Gammaproteobacteria bacterium]|nr:glucose 1-dehydrogenase [Gammaproteobacteria bacterium]